MSMKTYTKEQIAAFTEEQIAREIKKADIAYEAGSPFMTDETYDCLVEAFRSRKPDEPQIIHGEGSVKHTKRMLSLNKGYTEDDIDGWSKKIKGKIVGTLKLDGMAINLDYINGKLTQALTRGDGEFGEDLTDVIREVSSVPKILPNNLTIQVRGEAFLKFSSFNWISKNLDGKFENPRNTAAGAMKTEKVSGKRTDFSDTTKSILKLVTFEAYSVVNPKQASYQDTIKYLASIGFHTAEPFVIGLDAAYKLHRELNDNREKYDKPVDGLVLRADDNREYDDLGETGHHPKGAIAYKFSAEAKEAKLIGLEWNVGRTGQITPVGLVEPTRFPTSGVTVSRVTLHNLNRIKELGLAINATVKLVRSGDVIPTILGTIKPGDTEIIPPDKCPSCNAKTEIQGDFLVCTGILCKGSAIRGIEHYCKSVGIDGFGPAIVEQLYDANIVRHFSHLYTKLSIDNATPVVKEKTAKNLVAQVNKAKNVQLAHFLDGLGIPHLGTTMGRRLEAVVDVKSPKELVNLGDILAKYGDKVEGLGDVIKQNVNDYIPKIEVFLMQLDGIVTLVKEKKVQGTLTGSSFVFTGTLTKFGRSEAQKRVAAMGAETPSSVKAGLTYLVIGGDEGAKSSKQVKAEKLGVTILSETEFLKLIGE